MALALRILVRWSDDVVEDRVHELASPAVAGLAQAARLATMLPGLGLVLLGALGWPWRRGRRVRSCLLVGAGEHADVVAPGDPGLPVRFQRRRAGIHVWVPPGGAERVEIPGEAALDATALLGRGGFSGTFRSGGGRLVIGGAEVGFEVVPLERDLGWLAMGSGLAAIALLALFAGFGYHLVRQWGDGRDPRFGQALALGGERARFLRVSFDPGAEGATHLAAGEGLSRHGVAASPLLRSPPAPPAPRSTPAATRPPRRPHTARSAPPRPRAPAADPENASAQPGQTDEDSDGDDDADQDTDPASLREAGQQALLAAELRGAIDSLSAAEQTEALDYDNLNWLGLAHYFLGENAQARTRWEAALALDGARPDAVNNLGGIARRAGDTAGEIAFYEQALARHPQDCHALNSLALARAKQGRFEDATRTLGESDAACGGDYAYTYIQRAGILSLQGRGADALAELEKGLGKVDTMIPIKEYEVEADLLLDPAFALLRRLPAFDGLTAKYLPRAVLSKGAILASAARPGPPRAPTVASELRDPFADNSIHGRGVRDLF